MEKVVPPRGRKLDPTVVAKVVRVVPPRGRKLDPTVVDKVVKVVPPRGRILDPTETCFALLDLLPTRPLADY